MLVTAKKIGFDNLKYLNEQSAAILERVNRFSDKLYLEFGGKIVSDFHAARVLRRNVAGNVKAPDFAGNVYRKGGGIELADPDDAGAASDDILPTFFDGISDRTNETQTSDNDSATCQSELRMHMRQGRPWGRPCR